MEKCYRDIQNRGQIAKINILELFILIGVPLLLFPIFTLFNLNTLIILVIEVLLYIIFRMADRISTFEYGMASFIYSRFIWPQKLAAFVLDEKRYLKDEEEPIESPAENRREDSKTVSAGGRMNAAGQNGRHNTNKINAQQAARRIKQQSRGSTRG